MAKKIAQFKKGKQNTQAQQKCGRSCMQHKQMNQANDSAFNQLLSPWNNAFDNSQWLEPNIEFSENAKEINVSAELPGMSPDSIMVNVSQDGYLTISGEKSHHHEEANEENGTYFSERSYGMIQRTIPLPQDLDYDHTSADFENGVLFVHIPKSEAATKKVRKIQVQAK